MRISANLYTRELPAQELPLLLCEDENTHLLYRLNDNFVVLIDNNLQIVITTDEYVLSINRDGCVINVAGKIYSWAAALQPVFDSQTLTIKYFFWGRLVAEGLTSAVTYTPLFIYKESLGDAVNRLVKYTERRGRVVS